MRLLSVVQDGPELLAALVSAWGWRGSRYGSRQGHDVLPVGCMAAALDVADDFWTELSAAAWRRDHVRTR